MAEGAPPRRARGEAWWILAPIVLGSILLLWATAPRGPALSADSAVYLSVADALAQGRGFAQFDDAPLTRWPPLLPLLLAPASALGVPPARAAQGLNLLAFAAVLGLAASWLVRHVASLVTRALALALLLASATLLEAGVFVWSDLPFLALVLAALGAFDGLDEAGLDRGASPARRRHVALVAGLWTAAACLLRYAGLALVPVGVAVILGAGAGAGGGGDSALRVRRRGDALLFAVLALVPVGLWCAHNLVAGTGAFGPRVDAGAGPIAQGRDLLAALGVWLVGSGRDVSLRVAAGAALVAGWFLLLLAGWRRVARPPASVVAMSGVVVVSAAILVAWSSYSSIERLNERYTIPLMVPGVLLAAWAAVRAAATFGRRTSGRVVVALVVGATVLWIGVATVRTARHVERYRGPGEWGYNTAHWDRSRATGLLHAVAGLPPGARIYSDLPHAIYARLRRPARLMPPRRSEAAAGGSFWVVDFDPQRGEGGETPGTPAACAGCADCTPVRHEDGVLVRAAGCVP
ncbi:MAG: hypothetical protein ABIP29_03380 [Candidatus Eisenbacteria bacterium]